MGEERRRADQDSRGRVIFIGAAGEMCRVAIERFASATTAYELVLTDIRPDLLVPMARRLGPRATVKELDLYDPESLLEVITGASLVVLGAGPYVRTSGPVIDACLRARVPYLDFDDDVESTENALALDSRAKEAGIPLYIGCGASPGMSNVLAVDAAGDLDSVDVIDMAWLVGDERPRVGRAVLEHMLDISAGSCVTWKNGRRVVHESFVETGSFNILGGEKDQLLYETAHPEPVTLPRKFPHAERIRCVGGLDPAPLNGLFRGLGLAVEQDRVQKGPAIEFIHDVATGGFGSVKYWRHAISGMVAQAKRREIRATEIVSFGLRSLFRRSYPYQGGLMAIAYGVKNGKPSRSARRTMLRSDRMFNNMGGVTGTACAAFALLALSDTETRSGAFAPEDWADPAGFYGSLEAVGVPRHQIVENV